MIRALALVWLLGCGGGGGSGAPDAAVHIDAAMIDSRSPDAPIDASPSKGPALSRTLYVNTEGVMLVSGNDDATLNKIGAITSHLAAPWLANDAQRATKIAAVVSQIQTTLAAYNVSVVATRPAAAPYDMVVMTDTPAAMFGLPAGLGGLLSPTCNATPSVISLLFGSSYASLTDVQLKNLFANYAIVGFGVAAGIPMSTKDRDCMCYSDDTCHPTVGPCTIGGAATSMVTPDQCGSDATVMDEAALFLAAWGPHP